MRYAPLTLIPNYIETSKGPYYLPANLDDLIIQTISTLKELSCVGTVAKPEKKGSRDKDWSRKKGQASGSRVDACYMLQTTGEYGCIISLVSGVEQPILSKLTK
jgi:hypothetical protein